MESRRFNRIVASMAEAGLIEKVGIGQGRDGGTVNGVRLIEKESMYGTTDDFRRKEVVNEDKPNIAMTIPIEKQIVALVHAAGTAGASIKVRYPSKVTTICLIPLHLLLLTANPKTPGRLERSYPRDRSRQAGEGNLAATSVRQQDPR